jgi:hypothetical protein
MASASKKVLVPIADGSEEMEAVIVIDVLRRAGADVIVASTGPETQVQCSRGVKIVADKVKILIILIMDSIFNKLFDPSPAKWFWVLLSCS